MWGERYIMKKNQNIKCEVSSFKHCIEGKECNLESIKVSSCCDCSNHEVKDQEETICASFEKE